MTSAVEQVFMMRQANLLGIAISEYFALQPGSQPRHTDLHRHLNIPQKNLKQFY